MIKRIVTAVIAIAVFLPILYFSDTVVFAVALSALSFVAVLEMLRCTGLWRHWLLSVPACAAAVVFPVLPYVLPRATLEYDAVVVLIAALLYIFAVVTFSHDRLSLSGAAVSFMTCLYVIAAFTALSLLRYGTEHGQYIYLICFVGAWVTDTFAYFTGMLLGKHKLIPEVSPKKTVEGSIGGVIFCVAAMILYGYIIQRVSGGEVKADLVMLGISGLVISVVSQIGDLLMSAIKRVYGVKDYGKLFPGHGGVLDRFDSVMAVALVLYIITSMTGLFAVV